MMMYRPAEPFVRVERKRRKKRNNNVEKESEVFFSFSIVELAPTTFIFSLVVDRLKRRRARPCGAARHCRKAPRGS